MRGWFWVGVVLNFAVVVPLWLIAREFLPVLSGQHSVGDIAAALLYLVAPLICLVAPWPAERAARAGNWRMARLILSSSLGYAGFLVIFLAFG